MYLRYPRNVHLELSSFCNIKCPMCRRNSIDGLHSIIQNPKSLSLNDIVKCFKGIKLDRVKYCGSNGDPLMAEDAIKIFHYFNGTNQLIHTNGSLRTADFWKELATIDKMTVYFAIDGITQEILEKYRVGADLDKILNNAKSFIDNGGNAVWNMIKFKHNEHEIVSAQRMAKKMGFSMFNVIHTRRFFENDEFKYSYNNKQFVLNKPDMTFDNSIISNNVVDCVAKDAEEIYIDSGGYVWPCTYLADSDFVRENNEMYNIHNRNYRDIVFDEFFDKLNDSFKKNPIIHCTLNCQVNYKNKHERFVL